MRATGLAVASAAKLSSRVRGRTHGVVTSLASLLCLMGPVRVSASIDCTRARRSRNIASGGVCVLPCAALRCSGVTLRTQTLRHVRAIGVTGGLNLLKQSSGRTKSGDIARPALAFRIVPPFWVPAYVDRLYVGDFLDDDTRHLTPPGFRWSAFLTALAVPKHIARREVTAAISAIQYLSRRPAAQVL